MPREQAADSLRSLALMEHPDAVLGYVDRYRGYAFAYNIGRDRFLPALANAGGQKDQWDLLRRFILESGGRRSGGDWHAIQ